MAFPNNTERTFKLNTNHSIPLVGLSICKGSSQETELAVRTALETGYRHISLVTSDQDDLRACGVAIGESDVLREEVFLSMRLPSRDHARTQEAVESSLETLGVDYVDLLLMEKRTADDNTAEEPVYVETWVEMQRLVEARRVRSLGVSGFSRSDLETLLADERCTITPSANQISLDPSTLSRKLVAFNTSKGIHTMASSNLESSLSDNPFLHSIAKDKGRSVQQILLRWGLHRGWSVTPTFTSPERIRENLELDGWGLTVDEVMAIEGMRSSDEQ